MPTPIRYEDFPKEAALDEKQCAELIGWPLSVFREAVKQSMFDPPQLVYKGHPLWLARLLQAALTGAESIDNKRTNSDD